MKMKELGRTGIRVSELCLGTMTFGEQNTEAEGHAQLDMAIEAGINFFDMAEMYPTNPLRPETQGRTEEIVGSWLKARGRRDDIVIATKITGDGHAWIRGGGKITRATVAEAIEGSLRRLGTDCIDLYQIHWPNRGSYHFRRNWQFDASVQEKGAAVEDLHQTLLGIDDAVRAGKVRAFGLSNEAAWGTMQYIRLAEAHGLPRVASIQNEYNLLCRHFDLDLSEVAWHEDVGLLAFSPLAAGLLTGKYRGGAVPPNSRRSRVENLGGRYTPQAQAAVDAYHAVAARHGLNPVQMAIAFVMSRPVMTATILGATSIDQLRQCLGAAEVKLSQEVFDDIAATRRDHPTPF
jgi:Predicted oxidoreductases (related to aryl-alcohol dehydrogenases)